MPEIPDLTSYIMTGTKYLLPILALWILLRCIRSMLRERYEMCIRDRPISAPVALRMTAQRPKPSAA